MYLSDSRKSLNILILKILKEYSDSEHPLTQQQIIHLLKVNYDIECDRRTVKNNVLSLREIGYDISMEKGYYLREREFEDVELRMLIDSVLFSKNIFRKNAKELIGKLEGMSNKYFSVKVSHVCNLPDMQFVDNKQTMYTLDVLNDAISHKKQVSFWYMTYDSDFKLRPRRAQEDVVNPYQIVANNGRYYLICNNDKYNNVAYYRLDKIKDIKVLSKKAKVMKNVEGLEHGLNMPKHMAEHVYMFTGESVPVKLRTNEFMMNGLIDWFGKDFKVLSKEDDMITILVKCNENAMAYWALQYGAFVEVLEPEKLRARVRGDVKKMYAKYE